ncbi:MAG: B12-binding domain-containing radical SAM protein [Flavobacteriales bacterium]
MSEILLFIPPLTQLNTPYPATAYLSGFLKQQKIASRQGDLGLDLVLEVFSENGLKALFDEIEKKNFQLSNTLQNILSNRTMYETTIDSVISFLQNKNYTLAYRIATREFLPEASRFNQLSDLSLFFGSNGVQDKARYLCTLYLEDISDLIQATIGPHFGFSKYAERIARTAVSFKPIEDELEKPNNYLDNLLIEQAAKYFEKQVPLLVGFTVPFPGNLYGALKVGQWIKQHFPETKIAIGGGYANTELRDLYEPAVFNYVDFITLDDGEVPLLALYNHLKDATAYPHLKRTLTLRDGKVTQINTLLSGETKHAVLPAPTYQGLRLKEYLSMFDMPNPMHRLWNDGRWNKLTIARGCYWKKCSFCDISLDYISRFEQAPASQLVDRMEALIAETGETGFHFVDEAAPPLAMRDLAIEILKRGVQVTWWTNIRFEKTFSEDLCKLLAASGCIAVTGGLEVASDRLLALMEKGITVEQVSRVCKGFRDAGILVHAYLMYGFPTETEQETIDSLEVVRQLFENNLLQSAFWHQFAMTVHSPVGIAPEKYSVIRTGPVFEGFANNDLYHEDPTGAKHEKFSDGLKKALYNYMHGKGFELHLKDFFDFLVPHTEVPKKTIAKYLNKTQHESPGNAGYRLAWHGVQVKLNMQSGRAEVLFISPRRAVKIEMPLLIAQFIAEHAQRFEIIQADVLELNETIENFAKLTNTSKDGIVQSTWWKLWRNEVVWVIKS